MNHKLNVDAGYTFDATATKAKNIADTKGCTVEFEFNGVTCYVDKNTNLDWLWRDYANAHLMEWKSVGANCLPEYTIEVKAELEKKENELKERQEHQRREQEKKDNLEREAFNAIVNGIELDLVNTDEYEKWKAKNQDDAYGACIFEYAEGWGKLMQAEIAQGKSMSDCAENCSFKLGFLGITGFMYGAAVQILSKYWKHGEDLRKWHNKEYNHEGDGVVNPAVISIG